MEQNKNTVVLIDEDGIEIEFEIQMTLEVADNSYAILLPMETTNEEEAYIFRITVDEDGEDVLEAIEDDEEYDNVVVAYEAILNEQ
ncbi:MAG: DUF1292 domain-containing protein [Clostridiales bacterium]|nr:DUF1292 domain-containing protein [Clostridiales bacterium]